ncbi:MAG: hypothetical protein JO270_22055 [Acidobacteriaceae bacterium]|nr:hypothetical protein [Acidobacteriaceae bacterium]
MSLSQKVAARRRPEFHIKQTEAYTTPIFGSKRPGAERDPNITVLGSPEDWGCIRARVSSVPQQFACPEIRRDGSAA